ncbi:MAG: VOC family protein [Thermosynechococcaceae cyanobacterium]
MLKQVESILLFVSDISAAANWYSEIFGSEVGWENPQFAFIRAPGVVIGFHPSDAKCPGGVGGTTVYWEVEDIQVAIQALTERGARLHRGPIVTSFGAGAAMLIDPFGCTIGLNASSTESRAKVNSHQ